MNIWWKNKMVHAISAKAPIPAQKMQPRGKYYNTTEALGRIPNLNGYRYCVNRKTPSRATHASRLLIRKVEAGGHNSQENRAPRLINTCYLPRPSLANRKAGTRKTGGRPNGNASTLTPTISITAIYRENIYSRTHPPRKTHTGKVRKTGT